jgi:hypothetical protein
MHVSVLCAVVSMFSCRDDVVDDVVDDVDDVYDDV